MTWSSVSVVTNVIPYIMALSGLMVMMRKAGVAESLFVRNSVVVVVAILYSTYALYASGGTAMIGGVVIMMTGYLIYGFMSPRFEAKTAASGQAAS